MRTVLPLIRLSVLAVSALALVSLASGSAQAALIPGLFDTGVDGAGNPLAVGALNGHYQLNGTDTPVVFYDPAYPDPGNAMWIAAQADGGYAVNPNEYTLHFDLTGFDPTTAALSGFFFADHEAIALLNGNWLAPLGTTTSFTTLTPFSASSGFLPGHNVLSFIVVDWGSSAVPRSALLVSGLFGTADPLTTPPAVPLHALPLFASALSLGGFLGWWRKRKAAMA